LVERQTGLAFDSFKRLEGKPALDLPDKLRCIGCFNTQQFINRKFVFSSCRRHFIASLILLDEPEL
jgi:hypothetical protein